jgi:diaminopimelate decarboxylase
VLGEVTTLKAASGRGWSAFLGALPTPALVYDLDAVTRTVGLLRTDTAALPTVALCFAVKANRCGAVLRHLAALGLGADVASLEEHDLAADAGLAPIYATGPAFGAHELKAFDDRGVVPDLDSVSQVRTWREALPKRRQIGLRIRVPVAPQSRRSAARSPWSRFGVDPTDLLLHAELERGRLEVSQLHVHGGELASAELMERLAEVLLEGARAFPGVRTVNLGGGLEYLRRDRAATLASWRRLAPAFRELTVVLEPGRLVLGGAGYLVVEVRSVERGRGVRLATVDASAWNLMPWFPGRVVDALPRRGGERVPHSVAGCTCYEEDYFAHGQLLAPVEVGDRLVLDGAGAYSASLARHTHGLPTPAQWVVQGGRPSAAEPVEA